MKYVEVVAEESSAGTITAIAEKAGAHDFRMTPVGEDGMRVMRLIVADDRLQWVLDALQSILGAQPTARILVMSVEASLPRLEDEPEKQEESATTSREELYEDVERNVRLDLDFLVLVTLSTVVAAIGLIENNVAVVIGAMVIAPLLSPNLALSLGTALGDIALMRKSIRALFVGILLSVLLSAAIGFLWPFDVFSQELLARTEPGLDSVALALASGAAAALSMTTGLSSVLVGVMVAVAILPPAATLGLMFGHGNPTLAIGAGLLLAVNIVSINLASKIVFIAKGIYPRTWLEKKKAKRSMTVYVLAWLVALAVLLLVIYARRVL